MFSFFAYIWTFLFDCSKEILCRSVVIQIDGDLRNHTSQSRQIQISILKLRFFCKKKEKIIVPCISHRCIIVLFDEFQEHWHQFASRLWIEDLLHKQFVAVQLLAVEFRQRNALFVGVDDHVERVVGVETTLNDRQLRQRFRRQKRNQFMRTSSFRKSWNLKKKECSLCITLYI